MKLVFIYTVLLFFQKLVAGENLPIASKNDTSLYSDTFAHPCVTPNNQTTICIPLGQCPKLLGQLGNPNAYDFLKASYCGNGNDFKNPGICCGDLDNYYHLVKNKKKKVYPSTCGRQNITVQSRIVGGNKAVLGEFPWLARLIYKTPSNRKLFRCSGFLITPLFVLTAAHCLESADIAATGPIVEVHLGEHNTNTKIDCQYGKCALPVQVISVKKQIPHAQYNQFSNNPLDDIGLLLLNRSAEITAFVSPICILEDTNFQPIEYWISGWGRTITENASDIKMKLALPPYSHLNCTEKYKLQHTKITNKQICAGSKKNKDSCEGDSGGPLMTIGEKNHWYAAGIVSYGVGCGRAGWPGVYTNIPSYNTWIKKNIRRELKKLEQQDTLVFRKLLNISQSITQQ